MPCDSSHMDPSRHEKESRKAARLIVWVREQIGTNTIGWIFEAANNYYGNPQRIDELTRTLCTLCKTLDEEIIYNGRNKIARELADWWDDHQEADRIKDDAKKDKARKYGLRKQALSKLSKKEKEALGL